MNKDLFSDEAVKHARMKAAKEFPPPIERDPLMEGILSAVYHTIIVVAHLLVIVACGRYLNLW